MSWTLANGKMTGVYDPALAIFTTAESSMDGMAMKSGDPTQETDASFGNGAFAMTGKLVGQWRRGRYQHADRLRILQRR